MSNTRKPKNPALALSVMNCDGPKSLRSCGVCLLCRNNLRRLNSHPRDYAQWVIRWA